MVFLPTPTAVARVAFYLYLSVCLTVFSAPYLRKADAARITKVNMEMFQDESWKPIYFGVKRLR